MRILSLVTNDESRFYRQQVAGLRDRGHHVDVLSLPQSPPDIGTERGNRPMSAYAKYYLRAVGSAFGDYDVVHANYGLTAPPAVVQPVRPVVLSLWGSDLMGKYGWISRLCSKYAESVVVMSEEMAGLLDGDCHVVPHGIDFDRFRPLSRETAREKLGWERDVHHVLFPYSPAQEVKDFPRAERIVEAARDELDGGVELQSVTGVPHDRMPWYFNAADALLLTSKREGSPNSVKEAMACNLPVIATDVGDAAEQLDGVSPSAVGTDDDALATALADTLRSGERSNGRDAIAELRLENQIDRVEDIFLSVLDT